MEAREARKVRESLEELTKALSNTLNLLKEMEISTGNIPEKGNEKDVKTVVEKKEALTVEKLIKDIGIAPNIKGYQYIIGAIEYCLSNESFPSMTKELYPYIGKKFNTTAQRTERAIRHAIESAWDKIPNNKLIYDIFGNSLDPNKGKPTNSEFIAAGTEYIRRKMK